MTSGRRRRRDTGCLLGAACGLCQIRAEQAIASKVAYAALQREISALLRRNAKEPRTSKRRAGLVVLLVRPPGG